MTQDMKRIAEVLERVDERQQRERPMSDLERDAYELKIERLKHGGKDTGEPRQMNVMTVHRAVTDEDGAGLLDNFSRKIPPAAWAETETGIAVIACPCGEDCTVKVAVPRMCDNAAAGDTPEQARCPRAYLWDGEDVRVAFSPHPPRIPNAETSAAS